LLLGGFGPVHQLDADRNQFHTRTAPDRIVQALE
jgi:hypothetical protein